MHREVTQFTRLKGLMYLADDRLHLSCADFAEAYTGRHDWKDYEAAFRIAAHAGAHACVNFRVQGAIRSYAAGFDGEGSLSLFKNDNGYRTLASVPFAWESETGITRFAWQCAAAGFRCPAERHGSNTTTRIIRGCRARSVFP